MVLENIQRFFKENNHGLLLGFIAGLAVIYFTKIQDTKLAIVLLLFSSIFGAIDAKLLRLQKGEILKERNVLFIFFLIMALLSIGQRTGIFGIWAFLPEIVTAIGATIGLGSTISPGLTFAFIALILILLFLAPILAIISLILLIIYVGIPFGSLISVITQHFTLVLMATVITIILIFLLKRKK